jgi:hypothetical protein
MTRLVVTPEAGDDAGKILTYLHNVAGDRIAQGL